MRVGRTASWVTLWVFILLQADLKESVSPYIHWAASCLPLSIILFILLRNRLRGLAIRYPSGTLLAFVLAFILSVLTSGFLAGIAAYAAEQAVKLAVILLLVPTFLAASRLYSIAVRKAVYYAAAVNAALLIAVQLGFPGFAVLGTLSADGRFGTILNMPGSLWKLGMLQLVLVVFERRRHAKGGTLVGAAIGLYLIFSDGSRTGFLLLLAGVAYFVFAEVLLKAKRLAAAVYGGSIFVCGGLAVFAVQYHFALFRPYVPARVEKSLSAYLESGLFGADETRAEMLQVAFTSIGKQPLLGQGIGQTRVETTVGPMVVHNTFLQVWADLGLAGFVSYCGIAFFWLGSFARAATTCVSFARQQSLQEFLGACFILFVFAVSGLFHPLSSEWSEWIVYLIGISSWYWNGK